jgi:hypothetical protein
MHARQVIEKLVEGEVDPARFQLVKESLIQVYDSALLKPLAHCVHQRWRTTLVCPCLASRSFLVSETGVKCFLAKPFHSQC